MISDATLLGRFTGSNRRYVVSWSNGETAHFRARDLREARQIAREFTTRLTDLTLVSVERNEVDDA